MSPDFKNTMRVPFRDVDMHGHVHNGVYFSYFESAINDLLRHLGLLEHFEPDAERCRYYVRKVELVFDEPIGFDEVVDVRIRLHDVGRTSLTFAGGIEREGASRPLVSATIVWVCVDPRTRRAAPVPDATRAALAACGASPSAPG